MSKSKSELLNESIIDAMELKKAALKNAEQLLLKQYGPTIEEYVERVLEENMNIQGSEKDKDKDLILNQSETLQEKELPELGDPPAEGEMAGLPDIEDDETSDEDDVEISNATENTLEQVPTAANPTNGKIRINLGSATKKSKEDTEEGIDSSDEASTPQGLQEKSKKGLNLLGHSDTELIQEEDMPNLDLEDDEDNEDDESDEEVDLNEIKDILEEEVALDKPDFGQGTITTNKQDTEAMSASSELEGTIEESDTEVVKPNCKKDITRVAQESSAEEDEANIDDNDLQLINETFVKPALIQATKYFDKKIKLLQENNSVLQKENTIYKKSVVELRETLKKSNLLNTKLYFKNKILSDPSLNERQKNAIVEAITKAASKEKVETIYEVRKEVLGYTPKKEKTLEQILESRNYLSTFKRAEEKDDDEVDRNLIKRNRILAGLEKDID